MEKKTLPHFQNSITIVGRGKITTPNTEVHVHVPGVVQTA